MSYSKDVFSHVVMAIQDQAWDSEPTVQLNFRASVSFKNQIDVLAVLLGFNRTQVLNRLIQGSLPDAIEVVKAEQLQVTGSVFGSQVHNAGFDDLLSLLQSQSLSEAA